VIDRWRLYYRLNPDGSVEPCEVEEFGRQKFSGAWVIAKDRDEAGDDAIEVSTVFLGMDHNWRESGPPILFETLVFGGPLDGEMDRYCTRAEALDGHQEMCERVAAAKREK
jgi:hypothetical protein